MCKGEEGLHPGPGLGSSLFLLEPGRVEPSLCPPPPQQMHKEKLSLQVTRSVKVELVPSPRGDGFQGSILYNWTRQRGRVGVRG